MQRPKSRWWVWLAVCLTVSCEGAADEPDPAREAVEQISGSSLNEASPPIVFLLLDGEGLRSVEATSGATRALPFGAASGEITAFVERTRGRPPQEEGPSPCGGTFATWDGGLSLRFVEGRFVGWSTNEPGLTTAGGLGVGTTLVEAESVYVLERFRSSLGWEFTAGGLAGVLDGGDPSSRVLVLWAGEVCLGR